MTTATDTALHQALDVARRLSPRARAQLIAVLVQELSEPEATRSADAWGRWAALRDDIAQHYPDARLGERLEADRRERATSLAGATTPQE